MDFTFERTDTPALERYEIALLLDRKKMKEHILIGTRSEIRHRLNGNKDAELFHDEERPLGTLLTEFEEDKEKAWNQYGTMPLWNALHTNRFEQPALEKTAREFLEARYKFGTPLEKYAAMISLLPLAPPFCSDCVGLYLPMIASMRLRRLMSFVTEGSLKNCTTYDLSGAKYVYFIPPRGGLLLMT